MCIRLPGQSEDELSQVKIKKGPTGNNLFNILHFQLRLVGTEHCLYFLEVL